MTPAVPCKNCRVLHYKRPCRQPPRLCYYCDRFGHLPRYCPLRRGVRIEDGEPLPGTHLWCEMFGLDDDPLLRREVLNSLKAAPECSINVNGRCIYRGKEYNFYSNEPRGRPIGDARNRGRSRSPTGIKGQAGRRSRSPLRRYRSRSFSPERRGIRSRSPWRERMSPLPQYRRRSPSPFRPRSRPPPRFRSPSPFRPRCRSPQRFRAQSPHYTTGSKAISFEARSRYGAQKENSQKVQARSPPLARSRLPQTTAAGGVSSTPVNSLTRTPLAQASNNVPRGELKIRGMATIPPSLNATIQPFANPQEKVDDPYFILGIEKGALEAEVIDAYQQRMWEVELERISDRAFNPETVDPNNVWDESIKILKAAKKQLIGY